MSNTRITFETELTKYDKGLMEAVGWEITDQATTNSPKTAAAILRGIADRLDPKTTPNY